MTKGIRRWIARRLIRTGLWIDGELDGRGSFAVFTVGMSEDHVRRFVADAQKAGGALSVIPAPIDNARGPTGDLIRGCFQCD